MLSARKNYYKKQADSVAVLGYYVVMPFYNKPARLSQLKLLSKDAVNIITKAIDQAKVRIQGSFVVNDELYDDGIVEMYPIVSETHVTIYMTLPATISIQSAVSQVRIHASKFLEKTHLKAYKDTYSSLFSTRYLAMCGPADTLQSKCMEVSVYSGYLKTFFLENNLEGGSQNGHLDRERLFGKEPFMSKEVTFYK